MKVVVTDRGGDVSLTSAEAEVVPLKPLVRIIIRTLRIYLITALGLLGASVAAGAGTFDPLPAGQFFDKLGTALSYSIGPAVVSLLWAVVELLGRIDETQPQLNG